ncbi:hypothetical protein [Ammonifex thiophilus]|uniref:Uncharacterized protein n=1 Tax=Ammonifex thiophilus TaxID=444093 RepID=A0A3D8P2K0_9THEO|nr:hypothetical protein [Ammonifex thiophilus]RDV80739.1 hypothetical protein DXX99_10425 [Ammonifex thiophilus]
MLKDDVLLKALEEHGRQGLVVSCKNGFALVSTSIWVLKTPLQELQGCSKSLAWLGRQGAVREGVAFGSETGLRYVDMLWELVNGVRKKVVVPLEKRKVVRIGEQEYQAFSVPEGYRDDTPPVERKTVRVGAEEFPALSVSDGYLLRKRGVLALKSATDLFDGQWYGIRCETYLREMVLAAGGIDGDQVFVVMPYRPRYPAKEKRQV